MVTYLRRTSFENKIFIFQLKVFASRSSTNGTYWPLLWSTHGGRVVPEKGPEACAENCPPGCSLAALSWKLNRGMGVREDGGGKVNTGQDPVWGYGTSPTSSYFSCDPFQPRNNFEFVNWTQLACFQLSHNAKNVAVLLSFCTILTSSVSYYKNSGTTQTGMGFALDSLPVCECLPGSKLGLAGSVGMAGQQASRACPWLSVPGCP